MYFVKLSLNTAKEVFVFHIHKTTADIITQLELVSSENPSLYWCNSILFNVSIPSQEESFIKQTLGEFYIDTLTYTFSDKIEQTKQNGMIVSMIDVTGHSVWDVLTKSLMEKNIL